MGACCATEYQNPVARGASFRKPDCTRDSFTTEAPYLLHARVISHTGKLSAETFYISVLEQSMISRIGCKGDTFVTLKRGLNASLTRHFVVESQLAQ